MGPRVCSSRGRRGFGASLAPYIATWLARRYGLSYVGYDLTGVSVLTLFGLVAAQETKDEDLATIADAARR